jgi:endonuclease/exonuclease/phosphatase family metal-dependent hydrolase
MKIKKWALCILGLAVAVGASASLRVVSYSIGHGEGADRVINAARAGSLIARYNPDLVAIQEVDDNTLRSGRVNQAAELGRRLGMEYRFKASSLLSDGEAGVAILSAYPIKHAIFHNLPSLDREGGGGALEVVVDVMDEEGRTNALSFVCAHLGMNNGQRVAQVQALVRELSGRGHAVILAGNLNAVPGEDSIQNLLGAGYIAADDQRMATFPAADPTRKIDYILTKDLPIRHHRFVLDRNAVTSSHRLLFCEYLLGNESSEAPSPVEVPVQKAPEEAAGEETFTEAVPSVDNSAVEAPPEEKPPVVEKPEKGAPVEKIQESDASGSSLSEEKPSVVEIPAEETFSEEVPAVDRSAVEAPPEKKSPVVEKPEKSAPVEKNMERSQ